MKYKYKVETLKLPTSDKERDEAEDFLDNYGCNGFELVSTVLMGTEVTYFFKLREEKEINLCVKY